MAGHSKWAKVKHIKAVEDARKGKIFSKIAREITVAVRLGGSDPAFNPRLRTVLLKARAANMPADNVERAIKKGAGELEGQAFEEVLYEGFLGGVAFLIEVLTDNKNRTASEIRSLFTRHGGHLAAAKHLFQRRGQVVVARDQAPEDKVLSLALEAGAEDMTSDPDAYIITTDLHQVEAMHKALEAAGIKVQSAEAAFVPTVPVPVADEKLARAVLDLTEALEDHDDVQNVYSNADIPDALLEKLKAAA
ncbi:MAG: YebC/PmpR family DNA-binding transcriptional regulator [Verrucomicrobiae bacterium]|nr:YebC/PmpR family DNA-binding transcriptional regulator [Verrucomicrobiae bacterium]